MRLTDNTILITGGSGIGRGLAEAFHALGNQVIIAGRRPSVLEETAAANPGMRFLTLDQDDAGSIRDFAQRLWREHPRLNVLINNAGIQRVEDLTLTNQTKQQHVRRTKNHVREKTFRRRRPALARRASRGRQGGGRTAAQPDQ